MPDFHECLAAFIEGLQGLLRRTSGVKNIRRKIKPFDFIIKSSIVITLPIVFFYKDGCIAWICFLYTISVQAIILHDLISYGVEVPLQERRSTDPEFWDTVLDLAKRPVVRLSKYDSFDDLNAAAELEHRAFGAYSGRSVWERRIRLEKWLVKSDGLASFIMFEGETVGYSVIIPISKIDAERYRAGQLKEWGNIVSISRSNQHIYFYIQALYINQRTLIKKRRETNDSRRKLQIQALPYAAVARHIACLIAGYTAEYDPSIQDHSPLWLMPAHMRVKNFSSIRNSSR